MRVLVATMFCVLGLLACSTERGGPGDAAADVRPPMDTSSAEPTPPQWPCPNGWVPADGSLCQPWTDGVVPRCEGDEMAVPGEAGCVALGTACPAGIWPEGLPNDRQIIYVQADAIGPGSGTMDDPYSLLTSALPTARDGAVVALSKGIHREATLWLRDGVTLWGACVGETILEQPARQGGVLKVMGSGVELRNLTVRSPVAPCLVMSTISSAHLEGLVLECTGYGIDVPGGADLSVREVVVRDTQIDTARNPLSDAAGIGMLIRTGASATFDRVSFEGSHTVGILADQSARVVLRDSIVVGTQPLDDGTDGVGIAAARGASLTVERGVVGDNHTAGIIVQDTGSQATLSDLWVFGTQARALDSEFGRGIVVQQGATASIDRVWVGTNRDIGIEVRDAGTTAVLNDALVADTSSSGADARFGAGVVVSLGATLAGARLQVSTNQHWGIAAIAESSLDMSDVVVRATGEAACVADVCSTEVTGVGAAALTGGQLQLTRFRIDASALAGIQVYEAQMDLIQGVVRGSPIGASVSSPGFDIARINDQVTYIDNDRNLDQTMVSAPVLPQGVQGRRAQ